MVIHSINHVQLAFPAGSEGEIRDFYTGLLGLPEVNYPAENALHFVAGSQRIALVPTARWQPAPVASHLAFEVENLPELRGRLLQAELSVVENRSLPGYLRFYVKDPAGNQLEFLEPDTEPGALA
ncbi:VOC family protein [Paracidovorax anthurii]|uniref:Glyoxalase/bleomycin resistance protein/dioxygenase superfamily protein n=1 Tax=Paracidovorax anthurii TaxID=78229 RepID=A0A328Z9Z2_9BURK|nr:VOC family protein [Paracidovorax anthurii]RAR79126.1 glyoxalase/bleomycin resistance protein/dioxygenase superfamily protein [Paracidovorax anthurii]WCM95211.1 VOC family protein [Acidovorax sp. NCPPB 2350]